jgi:hypothetical protein
LFNKVPDRATDQKIGRTITSPGCEVDCEGERLGERARKVKLGKRPLGVA